MSLEFLRGLRREKTRFPWLSTEFVYVILNLAVFVELRLVTDRQTGGRTHDDS